MMTDTHTHTHTHTQGEANRCIFATSVANAPRKDRELKVHTADYLHHKYISG
jgi:hypothetical protein